MNGSFDISWGALWRIFFFGLFIGILFVAHEIFLVLFLALVISSGIDMIVSIMEKRGVPRTLGVILVFLGAILILATLVYFIVPLVIADLNSVFAGAKDSRISEWVRQFFSPDITETLSSSLNNLAGNFFSGSVTVFSALSGLLGGVGLAAIAVVISFYLSLSRDGVERFIRAVVPMVYEENVLGIYHRSKRKIGIWFQSQILLSVIVGLLVWVALILLGVPNAFLLGTLAAVFELVPFVGPIVSGGIAILFAFSVSATLALYTLIVFILIQQMESHLLIPLLVKRTVNVHPVIVIIAILVGVKIIGILGAILAVPAAVVVQEVVEERALARERAEKEALKKKMENEE